MLNVVLLKSMESPQSPHGVCGNGDTTVVLIWSEQPHYKHHSIRLKVRGEGNLSLAVERGKKSLLKLYLQNLGLVNGMGKSNPCGLWIQVFVGWVWV